MKDDLRSTAVFGASDGVVAAIGVVVATGSLGAHSVVRALLGLLVAEGIGMAVAQWLAHDKPEVGLKQALVMGAATSLAILAPAVPWFVAQGHTALVASAVVAVCVAAVISHLRPGGPSTWIQTYGVLTAVAAISAGAGHL